MSDIVERLRKPVMLHSSAEHTNYERYEAANYIVQLRELVAELADGLDDALMVGADRELVKRANAALACEQRSGEDTSR